jgi:hypothetical protein
MRPIHRWSVVAAGCALAVGIPIGVRAVPVADSSVSASTLLGQIRASRDAAYSGVVDSQGNLGLPISDRFTDVADLLGGDTRMRVWWRTSSDWRVDKLLTTGETDLFHHDGVTTEWDYERQDARTSIDPSIRLPRDADLLPPELANRVLAGVQPDQVTRLPARRVAGVAAPGLRMTTSDPRASVDHVDLWADPTTGVVLRVEVYADGSTPALVTRFTQFSTATPAASVTTFTPAPGIHEGFDDILDIADAANQYASVAPPTSLGGLAESSSSDGAVGIYGTGVTELMAVPLRSQDLDTLTAQLTAAGAQRSAAGTLYRVGPLVVLLTESHEPFNSSWLLAGTVTDQAVIAAANDLRGGTRYR